MHQVSGTVVRYCMYLHNVINQTNVVPQVGCALDAGELLVLISHGFATEVCGHGVLQDNSTGTTGNHPMSACWPCQPVMWWCRSAHGRN